MGLFDEIDPQLLQGLDMNKAAQNPGFLKKLQGLLGAGMDDPNTQGLLGMASQLLQASGPSTMPTSFGQALGKGIQGYSQGRQQGTENQLMAGRIKAGQGSPSTVQEWQYYNSLKPEDQARFLEMKRSQQTLNLGDRQVVLGSGGDIRKTYDVAPKPGEMPAFQEAQERSKAIGKESGIQESALAEMEGNLPRLETVVDQLGDLGGTATYTKSGQAYDLGRRELGLDPRKAAIARKEYTSKVDNEVLPLLRQTFGAAFTEREGTSLKATLGDPDASPEEKSAVLRSFIDSKRAQVETQRRRLGKSGGVTNNKQSIGVRKYNPQTGRIE